MKARSLFSAAICLRFHLPICKRNKDRGPIQAAAGPRGVWRGAASARLPEARVENERAPPEEIPGRRPAGPVAGRRLCCSGAASRTRGGGRDTKATQTEQRGLRLLAGAPR